jgi:hypothetical protein
VEPLLLDRDPRLGKALLLGGYRRLGAGAGLLTSGIRPSPPEHGLLRAGIGLRRAAVGPGRT